MTSVPLGKLNVTLKSTKGGGKITIEFSEKTLRSRIAPLAAKRGCTIEELVGEALRVETLLVDGKLYIHKNFRFRRLASV